MSSNFTFPPPPPPPPKPAISVTGSEGRPYGSDNRRGRGRGRGNDRGGFQARVRGRGSHPTHGNTRPMNTSGAGHHHSGSRGNLHVSTYDHFQTSNPRSWSNNLPSGTYVNPNFSPRPDGYPQSHGQALQTKTQTPSSNSPSRTHAGHKRKLDALRPPLQERKPAPQTAPVVPSFGTPILPPKPAQAPLQDARSRTKVAGGLFGLTRDSSEPQYSASESEDDPDDADEEAMYAELGTKLTFEHNGEVVSLSSAADIAAWQKDRKRHWPTQARMAEKEAEKRLVGEQRRQLLTTAARLDGTRVSSFSKSRDDRRTRRLSQSQPVSASEKTATVPALEPESKLQKAKRELLEQEQRLEAMRKRVAHSEAYLESARARQAATETADAALPEQSSLLVDYDEDDIEQEQLDSESEEMLSESSVVSSDSSNDAASEDDDYGPPEEVKSTPAVSGSTTSMPVCKYFAASGDCRDGDACRYRHELSAFALRKQQQSQSKQTPSQKAREANGESERKGIYQQLLQQQQEEEDRLALQAIKYLGKAGFFTANEES